jgi:hypothetical protein
MQTTWSSIVYGSDITTTMLLSISTRSIRGTFLHILPWRRNRLPLMNTPVRSMRLKLEKDQRSLLLPSSRKVVCIGACCASKIRSQWRKLETDKDIHTGEGFVSGSRTLICMPLANDFLRLLTILGQQYHRSSTQEFAEVLPLSPLQVFYNADLVE